MRLVIGDETFSRVDLSRHTTACELPTRRLVVSVVPAITWSRRITDRTDNAVTEWVRPGRTRVHGIL